MPIRINLLAEAQAQEELRRKDPVKRAIFGAAAVVTLAVLWCVSLQLKVAVRHAQLNGINAEWTEMEAEYKIASESQRKLIEAENKLTSLERLRTNRFLWATALNALQRTLGGLDNIQVVHMKTEQKYLFQEGTKPRTNGTQVIRGTPPASTEKISILIDAIDTSPQPGGEVNRFKESIIAVPYFKENLQQTNGVLLTSLSPPQNDGGRGRPFVRFSLQCFFPEKVR